MLFPPDPPRPHRLPPSRPGSAATARAQSGADTARRSPLRAGVVTLLALITAVVLTGCIKVDLHVDLHEDNTVGGNVLFAVQDSVAASLGTTPSELWAQVEPEITADWPAGTTREPYARGGYTGTRLTLPNGPLAELDDVTGQPLRIVRQGDEFFIDGEMDLNQLALEEGADQAFVQNMQAQISVTCPGRIIESNGTVLGNTVSWMPSTTGENQFTARCAAIADLAPDEMSAQTVTPGVVLPENEGVPRWIPALGVAFLLGLAGLAWALWRRSHHHEAEYLGLGQFDDGGYEESQYHPLGDGHYVEYAVEPEHYPTQEHYPAPEHYLAEPNQPGQHYVEE